MDDGVNIKNGVCWGAKVHKYFHLKSLQELQQPAKKKSQLLPHEPYLGQWLNVYFSVSLLSENTQT